MKDPSAFAHRHQDTRPPSITMKVLLCALLLPFTQAFFRRTFFQPLTTLAAATTSASENNNVSRRILDYIAQHVDSTVATAELEALFAELPLSNTALWSIGQNVYGIDMPVPKETVDTSKDCIIPFDYLRKFMVDVFLTYDIPQDRAETAAEVLVAADQRGIHSHGLGRLKPIYCDRLDDGILYASPPLTVVKETETTALLDGNLGLGLYIGPYAMQMAIDKAKKYGVGFVAVRNSTHYGIAGYYALMAAQQGCVGFTGTNARPSIAPTYGTEPMMGTNPLCFGMPSDDPFDFCIDCATSINQRGKIELYERLGVSTPRGCVIDAQGVQRTDTVGILRDLVKGTCALTPLGGAGSELGGYKGYGWAATVELLCIAFQSGPFGADISGVDPKTGKKRSMPLGHFFLAIDIEALCPVDTFKKNVGAFLRALRDSRKSPKGPGRIWTAGEPEYDALQRQTNQGGMSVPISLQEVMLQLRDSRPGLKEKYPRFPFE